MTPSLLFPGAAALACVGALATAAAALRSRRVASLEGELARLRAELETVHGLADRKAREVRALHDLTSRIAIGDSRPEPALSALVSIMARSIEADLVAVLLLDEAAGELVVQPGAYGLDGPERHYRLPLKVEQASSVRVFRTGRPFMTADAQDDPGVISSYARLWGVRSLMVLPVKLEGKPIGVLRVGSFRRGFFTAEHLDLLGVIADEAAVIVETAVLNRKLSETMEQLKASDRIKGEFVSMVSHEFKTPLTTILGFSTLLLEGKGGSLSENQTRMIGMVRTATRRLSTMVSELLDLACLESGKRLAAEPLSLSELAAACLESHRDRAEQGKRSLSCEVPTTLPPVLGDRKWLPLVLDNLVSNALKFTREGGRVRVWAEDKGEGLLLCVQDDGIGVPPGEAERVFERFYRGSSASEAGAPGTGLGLSIAREIVSRHGGRIWCESEPGEGTRFLVLLPPAERKEASGR